MKLKVDSVALPEIILDEEKRKRYLAKFKPENYPWGIEVQTCDRWTTRQQGKIWRDFTLTGKLLNCSPAAIYHIVKTNPLTEIFFEIPERVGTEKRGKVIIREKGLSEFTKSDCVDAIDSILDLLQMMVNNCYQEVVEINWSSLENKKNGAPDYEFTGIPYGGPDDSEE